MESKIARRPFLPIVLIFIVSSLFCLVAASWLEGRNIDPMVLVTGNGILFAATAGSFFLYNKALHDRNVQRFLRMMYSSLLLKMVFALGATLIYLFYAGKGVSKAAILCCYGLYILYSSVEVSILIRSSGKSPKNAKERSSS
jgi:hypothetical protein